MSKQSEIAKAEQLGVGLSWARIKLCQAIMFRMAQRLGEDICYRCGKRIKSVAEFSIDHKKPWLHIDPSLYWDINNIGFSHRSCNSGARRSRDKKADARQIDRQIKREAFARMYSDPIKRDRWNARRRELYKISRGGGQAGKPPDSQSGDA